MNPYASQASLECQVMQADPVGLIRLLYRGALDSIRGARASLAAGETGERSRQVSHASEIVAELMLSVNREQGGELAANLIELYDYILRLLTQANVEQTEKPLAEAGQLLQTLLEGWDAIAQQPAPPPVEAEPVPVSGYY